MMEAHTIGFSLVALMHSIGLFLLCRSKWELPNQKILTVNLMIAEMLYAYLMVITNTIFLSGIQYSKPWHLALNFFATILFTEIRPAVLHFIIDRFMEIYTNIKYPIYMPRSRMKKVVAFLWILSMIFAAVSSVFEAFEKFTTLNKLLYLRSLILDFIILASSITTYVYFYRTVTKIKSTQNRTNRQPTDGGVSLIRKKFKLPCFIVSTYILFNFTSTILLIAAEYANSDKQFFLIMNIGMFLVIAGFLADVFAYLFANKNVSRNLYLRRNRQVHHRKSSQPPS